MNGWNTKWYDRLALILSLLAILAAWLVTIKIFEGVPHLEDEVAYVWQARVMAEGKLTLPETNYNNEFLVPFIVHHNGLRFGKYPPGWPALLAIGIKFGLRDWINPLLAGLGVWLIYLLGKRLFNANVGLLSAGLTLTSPFFWMNSGSLLSHPLGLVLSAAFGLAWLDAFQERQLPKPWLPTIAGALALGLLALSRPYTGLAIAFPYVFHGLYRLWKGMAEERLRLVVFGLIVAAIGGLVFAWQFAVTGNALLNPYTLWWKYDTVGFGPGHGLEADGHTWHEALVNTRYSLQAGSSDLFGWWYYSWLLLPFGVIAARRNRKAWLTGLVPVSLVALYMAYWVGSWLFGPRYFYEGLPGVVIFSAAGAAWLAGWLPSTGEGLQTMTRWRKARPLAVTAVLLFLVSINLIYYLPQRLGAMHDLYGISRADLAPFQTPEAQKLAPALFIVHSKRWMGYAALLELESPDLTSPFIFSWSSGLEKDAALAAEYGMRRRVLHYYVDDPWNFYSTPKPEN